MLPTLRTLRSILATSGASALLLLTACSSGGGGGTTAEVMAATLNDALILPAGSFSLGSNPPTDSSVEVTSPSASGSLSPGSAASLSVGFTATGSSNVTGAAIGFGTASTPPSQVMAIPINTNGASSGTLNFQFAVDSSICDDLSQICHDIRCYEYAVVDGQRVSTANINQIAFACGACDEPSCQDLLDDCPGPGTGPGPGSGPSSTPVGIVAYAASGNSDLHIIDPTGFDHYVGGPSGSGAEVYVNSSNSEGWYLYLTGTYQVYIDNNSGNNLIYSVNATGTSGGTLLSQTGSTSSGQTTTWSFTIN